MRVDVFSPMDTNPTPRNPARLPIILLLALFVLAALVSAALAHRDHRLKFQLGLANTSLAAARSDLATANANLAAAQAQIAQLQAKVDAANGSVARYQAQIQQLAHMFGQSQRPYGKGHRMPVFAGFSRVPAQPGQPPPAEFKLRVRSMVAGPLQVTVKSTSSGKEKSEAYTINHFWTDPDNFAPGDKIEISTEGYPPLKLTVPALPPPPRPQAQAAKPSTP